MSEYISKLFDNIDVNFTSDENIIDFNQYLKTLRSEPWINRNSVQIMHDMMLSSGVEHSVVTGKPVKHRYSFFENPDLAGNYIVFGQQKAKENLVEKIDNAARGAEASKRLWILLGPPGSAKSRSMDALKTALKRYSASPEGKNYYLLLPSIDERLKDRALFSEKGIYYLISSS